MWNAVCEMPVVVRVVVRVVVVVVVVVVVRVRLGLGIGLVRNLRLKNRFLWRDSRTLGIGLLAGDQT